MDRCVDGWRNEWPKDCSLFSIYAFAFFKSMTTVHNQVFFFYSIMLLFNDCRLGRIRGTFNSFNRSNY